MVSTAHSVKIRPCFKGNLCAGARNGFARSNDALDIYTHIYFSSQVNIYISTVLDPHIGPPDRNKYKITFSNSTIFLVEKCHWLHEAKGKFKIKIYPVQL